MTLSILSTIRKETQILFYFHFTTLSIPILFNQISFDNETKLKNLYWFQMHEEKYNNKYKNNVHINISVISQKTKNIQQAS